MEGGCGKRIVERGLWRGIVEKGDVEEEGCGRGVCVEEGGGGGVEGEMRKK